MIGRIYQTQGTSQEPIYMQYFNDAIAKDPNFAPVYGWLQEYYYRRDINKAREYLDKYISVSDPDSIRIAITRHLSYMLPANSRNL